MPWIQVKLQGTGTDNEQIEDLLLELGAVSVTLEDSADQPLFEPPPGATPMWDAITYTGLFDAATDMDLVEMALRNELGADLPVRVEALEDKNWEREWMKNYKPIPFGNRLWVCPSWLTPPDPNAVNMLLDPGLAFGTGTHPTTAMCLQWLDAHDVAGKVAMDFGCGSGILAIAAALLGATKIYCIDNDPQALLATRENAERNGVRDRIEILTPEQLKSDIQVDVMLANILAGPLVSLAPQLSAHTKPGGDIVLSGILAEQASSVSDAYTPWFDMNAPLQTEDWIRLSGQKRA
ncbi:MAG TPA: 50S ribosomal protein L11 methyltransferase [Dongiaceae bacterium]|nr:50S ribosomal protein L11 methyltransferase [Dongiaceae bacterium]